MIGGCHHWPILPDGFATRGPIVRVCPTQVEYGDGFWVAGIDVIRRLSGLTAKSLSESVGRIVTVTTDRTNRIIAVEIE